VQRGERRFDLGDLCPPASHPRERAVRVAAVPPRTLPGPGGDPSFAPVERAASRLRDVPRGCVSRRRHTRRHPFHPPRDERSTSANR
jgi:hypothetical protein